jgi:hypothetical protein
MLFDQDQDGQSRPAHHKKYFSLLQQTQWIPVTTLSPNFII